MLIYRVLWIDVFSKTWSIKEFEIPPYSGVIEIGVKLHLGEFESWKYEVFSPENVFFVGTGPFAGSKLFGSHRMVCVFRSPESEGLHVSEMGGVGYKFIGSGVHGVIISGKAKEPTIIFIKGDENERVWVNFVEINRETLEEIYKGYGKYIGAYALTKWLVEKYNEFFVENRARAIVVGPSAWITRMGAVVSIDVDPRKKDLIIGSEDFAGRGGGGSVLAQAHNVAGIVGGGNWKPILPEVFTNLKKLNEFFRNKLGRDYTIAVTSATRKYRYDPKFEAGGTFGCNYPHYREWLPLFGYNNMYLKKEMRKKISDVILREYWKPFKDDVFGKTKPWKTCGEPCPVACKKIWQNKKVDYEPFHGAGPIIGVFNLKLSAEIVDLVDQLGFDAIAIGHVIAWLLEAKNRGLLTSRELEIEEDPRLDPFMLNVEKWDVNGKIALKILENLIIKKNEIYSLIAEKGIRVSAKKFDELFKNRVEKLGVRFEDLILYQPYGETGYITPNFYWTPGFLVPIFVTGKYWTEYSLTFTEPEEFANLVYERAIKEVGISNAGICRFHRGWAENFLEELYRALGFDEDFYENIKEVYRRIAIYNLKSGAMPRPLEGEKGIDLFYTLAEELGVQRWVTEFNKDKKEAYYNWHNRFFNAYLSRVEIKTEV